MLIWHMFPSPSIYKNTEYAADKNQIGIMNWALHAMLCVCAYKHTLELNLDSKLFASIETPSPLKFFFLVLIIIQIERKKSHRG